MCHERPVLHILVFIAILMEGSWNQASLYNKWMYHFAWTTYVVRIMPNTVNRKWFWFTISMVNVEIGMTEINIAGKNVPKNINKAEFW